MPPFPKTYKVVRGGAVEAVVVHNGRALLELRSELELNRWFCTGVTPAILRALDARLAHLATQKSYQARSSYQDVSDMRAILTGARSSINAKTIARIDAYFPRINGVLNMSFIEQESELFHLDVAGEIADSPVADAEKLADGFAEASPKATIANKSPKTVNGEPAQGTKDGLDSIENQFAAVADELAGLTDAVQQTVGWHNAGHAESDVFGYVESVDESALFSTDDDDNLATSPDLEFYDPFAEADSEAARLAAKTRRKQARSSYRQRNINSNETVTVPVGPDLAGTTGSCAGLEMAKSAHYAQGQIGEIKKNLFFQMERLTEALEGVGKIEKLIHKSTQQAFNFTGASQRAQDAAERLAAARKDAEQASIAFKEAQNRAAQASYEWEVAQRAASQAARHVEGAY